MFARSVLAVATLVATCCFSTVAHASLADDLRGLIDKGHFSPQQSQALLVLFERADRRGLPIPELTNRVREGIARRAEPKAILGVVQDRVASMEKADDVVRQCAQRRIPVRDRDAALVRLADSFSQGVTPGDVLDLLPAAVASKGDLEGVTRAAECMGRLDRKGFPPKDTREVVAAAMVQSWPAERMEGLVGLFLQADALHLPSSEVRDLLVEGIRRNEEGPRLLDRMRRLADELAAQERRERRQSRGGQGGSHSHADGRDD